MNVPSLVGDFLQIFSRKPILEPNKAERVTLNYEEAKDIGILFGSFNEENHKAINQFVKLLQKDKKNVKALAYFEEKNSNPYDFRFDFFTNKDIDNKGKVSSLPVNEFIERKFDFLYCINTQAFPPFEYIMTHSQAKCRIGRYHPNHTDSFDLMVHLNDESDSVVDLILQMLHYTRTLLIHN